MGQSKWQVILLVAYLLHSDKVWARKVYVDQSSSYCMHQGLSLSCYFNKLKDSVYLEGLDTSSGNIRKIYIHELVGELHISGNFCANMEFSQVKNAIFSSDHTCSEFSTSLQLIDSTVNIVPRYVAELDMRRSTVGKLYTETQMSQLEAVGSTFEEINVVQPISYSRNIKFHKCIIKNLISLKIVDDSKLVISSTTIEKAESESIYIEDTSASFTDTKIINANAEYVVKLGPNSHLTIQGTDEPVKILGSEDYMDRNLEAIRNPPRGFLGCHHDPTMTQFLIWLFIALLSFVEGFIILLQYTNFFRGWKTGRPRQKSTGDMQIRVENKINKPNWGYSLSSPVMRSRIGKNV